MHNKITDLPKEIIIEILSFLELSAKEVLRISTINKNFNMVCKENYLWRILLQTDFNAKFTSNNSVIIEMPFSACIKTHPEDRSVKRGSGKFPLKGKCVRVEYTNDIKKLLSLPEKIFYPNKKLTLKELYKKLFNINKKIITLYLKLPLSISSGYCYKHTDKSKQHIVFTSYLKYCDRFHLKPATMFFLYQKSIIPMIINDYIHNAKSLNRYYTTTIVFCKSLPLPPEITLKILLGIYQAVMQMDSEKTNTNFFKKLLSSLTSKKTESWAFHHDKSIPLPKQMMGYDIHDFFLECSGAKLLKILPSKTHHPLYKQYVSYKKITDRLKEIKLNKKSNYDEKSNEKTNGLICKKLQVFSLVDIFLYFPILFTEILDDSIDDTTKLPKSFCKGFFAFKKCYKKTPISDCMTILSKAADNVTRWPLSFNYMKLVGAVITYSCGVTCDLRPSINNKNEYTTWLSKLPTSDEIQKPPKPISRL